MKTLLILLLTTGLALSGQKADQIKARQAAWKASVAAETKREYTEAILHMKAYTDNAGDKYNASVRLGWLFYMSKNYEEAAKHYRLAAKSSQGALTPLLGLMNAYKAANLKPETAKACKAVLVLDKTNYTAAMMLAGLLYEEKNYRSAGLIYAKVNKLYPEDVDSMSGLGWCLFYEGKKSRALPVFTRLMVMAPDYAYAQKGYELCGGRK